MGDDELSEFSLQQDDAYGELLMSSSEHSTVLDNDEMLGGTDLQQAISEFGDLEKAREAIQKSQASADRLLQSARKVEELAFGVAGSEDVSTAYVDMLLQEARLNLEGHRLFGARKSIRQANRHLKRLEGDVHDLRRNIALLNRLVREKTINEGELELVLRGLRTVTSHAEAGEMGHAAAQIDHMIGDLVGSDTTTLNPFLFRSFWLGLETRWPAGGDTGVLLLRLLNDGDRPLPSMRLAPPAPKRWSVEPKSVDLPRLPPGGFVHLRFELKPAENLDADNIPLARKMSVMAGYSVRQGQIDINLRLHNKSMEVIEEALIVPWMPPSFTARSVPIVSKIMPDQVATVKIPLIIDLENKGDAYGM